MKRCIRYFVLLLALSMALAGFGCTNPGNPGGELAPPESTATPAPLPTATPEPTAPEAPSASEQLAALDFALFKMDAEADPLTRKLMLKDPDALGIAMPEATWGELSYDDEQRLAVEYEAFLAELTRIDRAALNEDEQLTYDTIQQELTA